jgi:CRP-like cAMP-binding protein
VLVIAHDESPQQLARLSEGDFFGELGLLSSQPRIASVQALVDTDLLSISPSALSHLVDHDPRVLKVMLRFLRDRLIGRLVLTSQLFSPFSTADREALAGRFRFLEIEPDTELITRGSKVDGLYILLTGTAVVRTDRDVATLGRGDLFGEMSLLSQHSALATVRTTSKCFALKLPAEDFRQAIMTHPPLLAYVSSIAAAREKQNAELAGEPGYSDGHLDLL